VATSTLQDCQLVVTSRTSASQQQCSHAGLPGTSCNWHRERHSAAVEHSLRWECSDGLLRDLPRTSRRLVSCVSTESVAT
jgi:hypothetical protein